MSAKHIGNLCHLPIITGIPQAPARVLFYEQITSMLSKSKSHTLANVEMCSIYMVSSIAKVHVFVHSFKKEGGTLNTHTCRGGMGDGS